MIILKILFGLIGLGIVVFVHELGHFLLARRCGIEVTAFSIGWGKPIIKKKVKNVEYRLGMFFIGGYCSMKGENDFAENWEKRKNGEKADPSSFYGAHFLKRILVAFAGPFFNFAFAVFVLSAIWGIGIDVETLENRIVLLKDIDGLSYPADKAGLLTGDRIVKIDGKEIATYHDIQENIAINPQKTMDLTVDRGGAMVSLVITPNLDKSGSGKIGVYPWTDPVIASVAEGSPAERAGLRTGDRIVSVNGRALPYSVAVFAIFRDGGPADIPVEYERSGALHSAELSGVSYENGSPVLGIEYKTVQFRTPTLSPPAALVKGVKEAVKTLVVSVKSLALLFKGIDLTQAVSGPARITYMIGDIAAQGFGESIGTGISSSMSFLALISIALCFMNLLPLPILDGGLIVLSLIEGIIGRPLNPKFIQAFQTAGVVIIFGLMIFSFFNDILFFAKR
jgi:regulator of sigma E protease